ncbi:MAG: hypothetical protein WAL90_18175 [Desulfobacterales bacterium]
MAHRSGIDAIRQILFRAPEHPQPPVKVRRIVNAPDGQKGQGPCYAVPRAPAAADTPGTPARTAVEDVCGSAGGLVVSQKPRCFS